MCTCPTPGRCAGIALIGYYLAATVVDNRYIGRLRLQLLGFAMVATLFMVSAIWYHPLTSKGGIHVFQFVSTPTSCPTDTATGIKRYRLVKP